MLGHMTKLSLKASKRTLNADKTRAQGNVPGVVYGRGLESMAISINELDFNKVFEEAGEATILTLEVDGAKHDVLIHDYQRDPVAYDVCHVDFYAIEAGQEITVSVPLEFIGETDIEDKGGQIIKVHHELEVTCQPADLPNHIDVDISVLHEIGDAIHVSDLKLPGSVKPELPDDEVIVSTSEAKEMSEEDDESGEVDLSAIQVEGQSDGDDEGAGDNSDEK